ncbi:hypothetical protein [Candidatus Kryptonium thompsonii]|uniref:hypothetical protein n=1 Tax=Candidatus Kryptonium thompsonii TaxID=1633631 RepID=UPI00070798A1|nr:hypothetical protein [Candidatus Kryptonium thompsoni]CUS96221.1 hypothetical protein JGI5_00599 [Candidatus Kryptonium thompsoni]
MQPVNFRYLFPNYGGLTLLFIDYIYNFKSVKEFYNHDFNDFDNLPSLIETVLKNYKNRGGSCPSFKEAKLLLWKSLRQ